jgi:hypothetical protein
VCAANDCGGRGECIDSTGAIICRCDPGYAGEACGECSVGFHDPGDGTCALNEQCQPRSCPAHSTCDESGGVVICACDVGYDGEQCQACAAGYYRNFAQDRCLVLACEDNPITAGQTVSFDTVAGFPRFENNCVSGVDLGLTELELRSIAGDGEVWACAQNTLYGLSTQHLFIEAGSQGSAELRFTGPIGSLSFDYGARSELSLEVLADGENVGTLAAARRSHSSLAFTFDAPITVLALRSVSGATNQIALDNIAYAPPPCD